MIVILEQNWAPFVLVLLIGLLAWWLWTRRRSASRQRHHAPDALDEGAAPAARNQAFIDAPSAAAAVTAPYAAADPGMLGGIGEIAALGALRAVDDGDPRDPDPAPLFAPDAQSPAPAAFAQGDDLTRIKGVGAKLSNRLAALGVTGFAQIAGWTDADLARIDGALGAFAGRPLRDDWIGQCRYLAAGDVAGYEARFGKL